MAMSRFVVTTVLAGWAWVFPSVAPETPARGLWVWDTAPLLHDAGERRAFFAFCAHHDIGVVGIQIGTDGTGTDRHLAHVAEWQGLIGEATRRGIRLHALDGDPTYARRSQRETALSIVDAVVAYNRTVRLSQRFYGVHFDIEPYLLPEWTNPGERERLLADYLELDDEATRRSHAVGLVYGWISRSGGNRPIRQRTNRSA